MTKHKLFKKLTGVTMMGGAILPVLAVVACSKAQLLTSEQADINNRLSNAGLTIERSYQEKLLIKNNANFVTPTYVLATKALWDQTVDTAKNIGLNALNALRNKIMAPKGKTLPNIAKPGDDANAYATTLKALAANDSEAKDLNYTVEVINDFLNGHIVSTDASGNNQQIKVLDLVKYFIEESVYNTRDWLKTFGTNLLNQDKRVLEFDTATSAAPVADQDGKYAKISYQDLDRYQLLRDVPTSGQPWVAAPGQESLFDELAKIMVRCNFNGFRNDLYKFFIAINYFNTSKDNWSKVYHNTDLSNYYREYSTFDGETDDVNFLLTKSVIDIKPFFTWTATLDATKSQSFIGAGAKTSQQMDQLMTDSAQGLTVDYSTRHKKLSDYQKSIFAIADGGADASNFVGYGELQKRSATGTKSLSFTLDEMKKATGTSIETKTAWDAALDDVKTRNVNNSANAIVELKRIRNTVVGGSTITPPTGTSASDVDTFITSLKGLATTDAQVLLLKYVDAPAYYNAYSGYLFKDEVRQSNIELFNKTDKTVSVSRLVGIMPTYVNGHFTMAQFNTLDKVTMLKEELYFLDAKDIYDDALTYFVNKPGDRTLLTIKDEYLRNLALDKFGYPFVDKDGNENNNND